MTIEKKTTNSSLIGIYRPGLSSINRLIATSVGRTEIVADLIEHLERQVTKKKKKHVVIEGAPGLGKTHFIKIFGHHVRQINYLRDIYTLVQFPTDNFRLLTFTDWILELLRLLAITQRDEAYHRVYEDLSSLEDAETIQEAATEAVNRYCRESGKQLLVLYDRWDRLLLMDRRKGKTIDSEFQRFFESCPLLLMLGSSALLSESARNGSDNLIQPFKVVKLESFQLNQTIEFIRLNLEWDHQQFILDDLDSILPKIQALQQMTRGNPRLVMAFYGLIVDENRIDIKKQFERLLDRLTPFYQDRLNALNPSERAMLATLSNIRRDTPSQAKLMKTMRISQQTCSTLLNKLLQADLITVSDHPSDKRAKIYRIAEGFFDLWLAIGQMQDPQRFLPLMVEFLSQWYSDAYGRERKRQQLWNLIHMQDRQFQAAEVEQAELLLEYLADLGDPFEKQQAKLEISLYFAETGRPQLAKNLLQAVKESPDLSFDYQWLVEQIYEWINDTQQTDLRSLIQEILICWKHLRIGEDDQASHTALKISESLIRHGFHAMNISFLKEVTRLLASDSQKIPLLAKIAGSLEYQNDFDQALTIWTQILTLSNRINDLKSKATALNNISQLYQDQELYQEALTTLHQAMEILLEIKDLDGQATTLNNQATIYYTQGYYEKALELLLQALALTKNTENIAIEAITLSNISLIYQIRQDYQKARENLQQSLNYMRKTANEKGETTTLCLLTQICLEQNDLEQAADFLHQAIHRLKEMRSFGKACESLIQLGAIHWKRGETMLANRCWSEALKLAEGHHFVELLDKLRRIEAQIQDHHRTDLSPDELLYHPSENGG